MYHHLSLAEKENKEIELYNPKIYHLMHYE